MASHGGLKAVTLDETTKSVSCDSRSQTRRMGFITVLSQTGYCTHSLPHRSAFESVTETERMKYDQSNRGWGWVGVRHSPI